MLSIGSPRQPCQGPDRWQGLWWSKGVQQERAPSGGGSRRPGRSNSASLARERGGGGAAPLQLRSLRERPNAVNQQQGRRAPRASARARLPPPGSCPVGIGVADCSQPVPGQQARPGGTDPASAGAARREGGQELRGRRADPGPARAEKSAGPRGRSERAAGQCAARAEGGAWAAPGLPAPAAR